jgi:hypothetical protein
LILAAKIEEEEDPGIPIGLDPSDVAEKKPNTK